MIQYNSAMPVQTALYISEEIQDFTCTRTTNASVLSKRYKFWPENFASDFVYVMITLPLNITNYPSLQNIISKRGAICKYFLRNSTSAANVCTLDSINLHNATCKCMALGHIVIIYNETVDNVPDIISSLSIVQNLRPKVYSQQLISPLILNQVDNGGFKVTTIDSNMSVKLVSIQSNSQNATLTSHSIYFTSAGVVNISDLRVDEVGMYRFRVNLLGSSFSIETADVEVTCGQPSSLQILRWPSDSVSGELMIEFPLIAVLDVGFNVTTDTVCSISMAAHSSLKIIFGKTTENTNQGIASFETLLIYKSGLHNIFFSIQYYSFSIWKFLNITVGKQKYLVFQGTCQFLTVQEGSLSEISHRWYSWM